MNLQQLKTSVQAVGASTFIGYSSSGSVLPFVCLRPLTVLTDSAALSGHTLVWDDQVSAYCAGASVEASYNLAKAVVTTLQASDPTLSCSIGYIGTQVEGHYETQVTIQANQGAIV